LNRPREWSLTMPSINEAPPIVGRGSSLAQRRRPAAAADQEEPPPPVGPTRAPIGFALVAVALLLLLLTLLTGCMRLDTSLEFVGPGRLRLSQEVHSATGQRLPWQQQLQAHLVGSPLRPVAAATGQRFEAPTLPAAEALALMQRLLVEGAALAGLELPPPQVSFSERNWLLGVRQNTELLFDLRALAEVPGLQLGLRLSPLPLRAVQLASPQAAIKLDAAVRWPLEPGQLNSLRISCWRWSGLGLGAVAILALLLLVLLLQRLRLLAGFGWPALPS
ncbi:MAG: DUF3153 domain-containing protein, partial [Prochlorococcaceae cyanobacterium]